MDSGTNDVWKIVLTRSEVIGCCIELPFVPISVARTLRLPPQISILRSMPLSKRVGVSRGEEALQDIIYFCVQIAAESDTGRFSFHVCTEVRIMHKKNGLDEVQGKTQLNDALIREEAVIPH